VEKYISKTTLYLDSTGGVKTFWVDTEKIELDWKKPSGCNRRPKLMLNKLKKKKKNIGNIRNV
jgi:hypothetical protein